MLLITISRQWNNRTCQNIHYFIGLPPVRSACSALTVIFSARVHNLYLQWAKCVLLCSYNVQRKWPKIQRNNRGSAGEPKAISEVLHLHPILPTAVLYNQEFAHTRRNWRLHIFWARPPMASQTGFIASKFPFHISATLFIFYAQCH
jgi:hypothetical protein